MHELNEASHILQHATRRSLVIMDELGRGTSTHDGVAIAHATCAYLVRHVGCLTLFVTHYPSIAELAETEDADRDSSSMNTDETSLAASPVANFHMSFIETAKPTDVDAVTSVTFLYKLVEGAAARSYGLNVARLASIPEHLIQVAAEKSSVRFNSSSCTETIPSVARFSQALERKVEQHQQNAQENDTIRQLLAALDSPDSYPKAAQSFCSALK